MDNKALKVGDSVVFKNRVRDSNTIKFFISGWQGRIEKITFKHGYIFNGSRELHYFISFDSITLQNMPHEYIKEYLKYFHDFRYYYASIKHFKLTTPRDTVEDVKAAWKSLEQKYHYKAILKKSKPKPFHRGPTSAEQDEIDNLDDEAREEYYQEKWEEFMDESEFEEVTAAEMWIRYEASLENSKHNLKVGDSVKIKQGVIDYVNEKTDMSGWQGRITTIYDEDLNPGIPLNVSVDVEFDSITLLQMSDEYLQECLISGEEFRYCDYGIEDIELTSPRDTKEDVIAARLALDKKYDYSSILDLDFDEPEVLLNEETFNYN